MPGYARSPRTSSSAPSGRRPQRRTSSGPSTAPVRSDLEQALDAAAEVPSPAEVPTFAQLGLPERLVSALARRGMEAPFAIQVRALPDALAGRDVLGRGQTGSGKTLAFGLPLLARLAGGTRTGGRPRGLVLVPTRELAQQVHDALAPLAQALDLKVSAVYGGASMGRQIDQLRRGIDVVVATPGRLQDLIEQRECHLGSVEVTVLDEADHMADLGFLPAVTALLDTTPDTGQRLLFSATLDRGVDRLVRTYLSDPALHAVAASTSPVELMDHKVWAVQRDAKVELAAEVAARPARTLFFVRTKHGADRLAEQLQRTGVKAEAIHGNLTQSARRRALEAFSTGHARVLVATDVAARGIHVDDVDLVVHYDPPADSKDYLHRSGRTARAGAKGTVLSFVLSGEVRDNQRMRERAGVEVSAQTVVPGHPAVREIAESGEPVIVTARAPRPVSDRARSGAGRPRREGGRPEGRSSYPRSSDRTSGSGRPTAPRRPSAASS